MAAVKSKTDVIPASPAAVGSAMGSVASVVGNVGGKVLGGGTSAFAGEGAQVSAEISLEGMATEEQVDDLATAQAALAATQVAILGRFAAAVLAPVSPVSNTGTIEIYRGVDYNADLGNAIEFALPEETHGDLTAATIVLQTEDSEFEATVVGGNTENQLARIELTAEQTTALIARTYTYKLLVTMADGSVTDPKAEGALVISDFPQPVEAS